MVAPSLEHATFRSMIGAWASLGAVQLGQPRRSSRLIEVSRQDHKAGVATGGSRIDGRGNFIQKPVENIGIGVFGEFP
jgi:hypothetical protein